MVIMNNQTNFIIPIIINSQNYMIHARKIYNNCQQYDLCPNIRICSYNFPKECMKLVEKYNINIICFVVFDDDKLSDLIDSYTIKPVLRFTSSNSINNIMLSIFKLCALIDNRFIQKIHLIRNKSKNIMRIENLRQKYINMPIVNEKYVNQFLKDKSYNPKLVKKGKIRDIFEINLKYEGSQLLMLYATNKISSFDRILGEIPYKGFILNNISKWWFKECSFVPNHMDGLELYNKIDSSRSIIVRKCKVFPIEFVMRGYMTGSTNTSIWKNYDKGVRIFCGHFLRDNYFKNEKLDEILLTPTTKSDKHDKNVSEKEIINEGIMSKEDWDICKKYSYELFRYGQYVASKKGMILVDTKYEFGKDKDGKIYLVDELHTPDSSRYWIKHNYKEQLNKGYEPDQISKEFVRQWVRENIKDPYNPKEEIVLPKEIINRCSNVYRCLYEILCS